MSAAVSKAVRQRQGLDGGKHLQTAACSGPRLLGLGPGGAQLLEVSPGDEHARLAALEDQAADVLAALQIGQRLFQVGLHHSPQRVGAAAGQVEGQ